MHPWGIPHLNMYLLKHTRHSKQGKRHTTSDAPLSSLMDSTATPKVKTTKGEKIRAHSLTHNTSGVEGHVGALKWD